jgi:hypothetical protein
MTTQELIFHRRGAIRLEVRTCSHYSAIQTLTVEIKTLYDS